jgi:hypothetical protein
MKLSNDTLNVLKNFASINQGILFKKGKTIRTVSSGKNIMAEAVVGEEIPTEFGVYDLNNFLSVLSLHKEEPTIDFEDNNVLISGLKGRSKIKYRFCAAHMIVTPPEKPISMPDAEISFELSTEDFDWILRAANVLSSPHIAIESNGSKIYATTLDIINDSAHTDSVEISDGNGDSYRMIFKTENFKMLAGGYDVKISSKGISHFKHKTANIQYWIATEAGSTFTKAK